MVNGDLSKACSVTLGLPRMGQMHERICLWSSQVGIFQDNMPQGFPMHLDYGGRH